LNRKIEAALIVLVLLILLAALCLAVNQVSIIDQLARLAR